MVFNPRDPDGPVAIAEEGGTILYADIRTRDGETHLIEQDPSSVARRSGRSFDADDMHNMNSNLHPSSNLTSVSSSCRLSWGGDYLAGSWFGPAGGFVSLYDMRNLKAFSLGFDGGAGAAQKGFDGAANSTRGSGVVVSDVCWGGFGELICGREDGTCTTKRIFLYFCGLLVIRSTPDILSSSRSCSFLPLRINLIN